MNVRIGQIASLTIGGMLLLTLFAPFSQAARIPEDNIEGFPAGWADDIRLTNNIVTDGGVCIDAENSEIHLTWTRNIGNYEVFHMKSNNGGRLWGAESQISSSGVSARTSDVNVKNGTVHIVWEDRKTPAWEIFYRNSNDGGDTWNSEKRISANDGFNSQGPKIAISPDGQNIHVIWVDSRHGAESVPANTEIYYNWSLDGGITWGTEKRLTNALYASAPVGIAVNCSNIHVMFVDDRTGTFGLYYIRSRDNGVTWDDGQNNFGDARLISTNAVLQGAMAINGSNIHTVWVNEQAGPTCRIYYRNSTDNGGNWSTPTLLTGPNLGSYAPDVGVGADNVWVTWNDKRDDGSTPELYYKNSTSGGINWGTDTLLTEADGNSSGAPKIAIIDASIHIAWEDQRDGNKEIYYKRFPGVLPDTEPPDINHVPIPSANISQTINITANITDDMGVDAVYLNYTGINATNYNVSMNQWDGNWSYDIPGQDNIGFVDYFIWCNDTSGNANQTIIYQIQINDITDPEINHIPIASANVFGVINITANITDDIGVDAVCLNYTGVNATNYNVSMNQWNGNWSFDIPGQDNIGTVNYFIWCNDTTGNDNQTIVYQIQINDVTDPEINHFPVPSAYVNNLINITANITDEICVNKVFLNYTGINNINYNISMNQWNGNYSFDIPGQSNSGFVSYFIWCNDSSDNDNMTQNHQIQIYDVTDPEINHVPITSINISETINITANVTDDVSVSSVYLNYTGVNGTSYNVSMVKWNGNYSYEISGQDTIGVINYFIWAIDSDGNNNRTVEYSVQINDITKPEINHVPVVSANFGELINITVNVTDDVEIDFVYLNYTDVNGNNYNVSMNKYDGNWSYEVTGQNDIGVVTYFVWANDTSGNDNQTIVYQIQIIDVAKPEIEHTPVISVNVSEVINITAKITDDVEIDSVQLNYTDIDGTNNNVSMSRWNGNWAYEIPEQNDVGFISYFIWCNDTSGNDNRTVDYTTQINEVIIPDTIPPTIVSTTPTGVNASISTTITITFDEPMNISSVQNSITISPAITISDYSWNADSTTLTITPSGNLSYNTTYYISIGIGAKDIAGNNLASVYSWGFTTELEPIINGHDDGGIGEYWWIILIIVIVIIIVLYLFWRTQKEEEPDNIEKES